MSCMYLQQFFLLDTYGVILYPSKPIKKIVLSFFSGYRRTAMEKIYFTLTGTKHYFGAEFLESKMKLELKKEPDNEHDNEAIYVAVEGLGKIGYVANSPYTVIGESMSAGRMYDKIGDTAIGEVLYITTQGILCKVCEQEPAGNELLDNNEALVQAILKAFKELNNH